MALVMINAAEMHEEMNMACMRQARGQERTACIGAVGRMQLLSKPFGHLTDPKFKMCSHACCGPPLPSSVALLVAMAIVSRSTIAIVSQHRDLPIARSSCACQRGMPNTNEWDAMRSARCSICRGANRTCTSIQAACAMCGQPRRAPPRAQSASMVARGDCCPRPQALGWWEDEQLHKDCVGE